MYMMSMTYEYWVVCRLSDARVRIYSLQMNNTSLRRGHIKMKKGKNDYHAKKPPKYAQLSKYSIIMYIVQPCTRYTLKKLFICIQEEQRVEPSLNVGKM